MTKSKFVNGYQVFYDDYEHRWVKAIGPAAREWEMRNGSDFTTAIEYTTTVIKTGGGTSAITQGITAGAKAAVVTGTTENDSVQIQLVGTPFQIASGKPFYLGCKCSISDATESDFFVGLASKDTNIIATHAIALADDGVYFYKLDGGTSILAAAEKSGTVATAAVGTAMDTSSHIYEIDFDGNALHFYLDGLLVSTMTAGWPTAVLSPSWSMAAGAAASKTASIEWMRCIQLP
jgi:hypothetical protein